jgi:hypothetical protein
MKKYSYLVYVKIAETTPSYKGKPLLSEKGMKKLIQQKLNQDQSTPQFKIEVTECILSEKK